MKLAKTARGVLKSLRQQQTNSKSIKASKASETRYNVVLTSPQKYDTSEELEEVEAGPVSARLRKARRPVAAGKEGQHWQAGARHSNMGQQSIAIHEDVRYEPSTDRLEVEDMVQLTTDDDDESLGDDMSECSEDSEDEVDDSVVEDMRRLEESFRGISQKYRLINRIGEGRIDCYSSLLL